MLYQLIIIRHYSSRALFYELPDNGAISHSFNLSALLMGMQTGATMMENSV